MDLKLLFRVLARFRVLVAAGVVVAVALAFLSYVRIGWENGGPTLAHRTAETWSSQVRVLLTQPGFGWGSSLSDSGDSRDGVPLEVQTAMEGRLPTLATIYASFVTADDVRRILRRSGPIKGLLQAAALEAPNGGAILPIIVINAVSETPGLSRSLGDRAAAALAEYVEKQQRASGIRPSDRIQLRVLNRAGMTTLIEGRSKTLPAVVLLVMLAATIGLALVLENLNPRLHVLAEPDAYPSPEMVSQAGLR